MQTIQAQPAELFNIEKADSTIRLVFERGLTSYYAPAAQTYLSLIQAADSVTTEVEAAIVRRHLAQLYPILPDPVRIRVFGTDDLDENDMPHVRIGKAAELVSWWQSQDPLPATAANERLMEHLDRVVLAMNHYPYDGNLAGYDDRGGIFVRLGNPDEKPLLDDFIVRRSEAHRYLSELNEGSLLPDNEFWQYKQIDRNADFLFVKRNGRYRISSPIDLLPSMLQRPLPTNVNLGEKRARSFLLVYYRLLERLSMLSQAYSPVFSRFSSALMGDNTATHFLDGSTEAGLAVQNLNLWRPKAEIQFRQIDMQRDRTIPRSHTELLPAVQLSVDFRWTRFLNTDGSTRTDVYWSIPSGDLPAPVTLQAQIDARGGKISNRYVIRTTAVQQTSDFRTIQRLSHQDPVTYDYLDDRFAPVFQTTLSNDSSLFHMALQWDQYMVREDTAVNGRPLLTYVRSGIKQIDSLQSLNSSPGALEISDLLPVQADPGNGVRNQTLTPSGDIPYPFHQLRPDVPLALYFELYHLTYGPNDRTRCSVEYQILHRDKMTGINRLLGSSRGELTAARTTIQSDNSSVRERVYLDLSALEESVNELTIRVFVTDENSGQQVFREI